MKVKQLHTILISLFSTVFSHYVESHPLFVNCQENKGLIILQSKIWPYNVSLQSENVILDVLTDQRVKKMLQ